MREVCSNDSAGMDLRRLWVDIYRGDLRWGVRDVRRKFIASKSRKSGKNNDRNTWIAKCLYLAIKTEVRHDKDKPKAEVKVTEVDRTTHESPQNIGQKVKITQRKHKKSKQEKVKSPLQKPMNKKITILKTRKARSKKTQLSSPKENSVDNLMDKTNSEIQDKENKLGSMQGGGQRRKIRFKGLSEIMPTDDNINDAKLRRTKLCNKRTLVDKCDNLEGVVAKKQRDIELLLVPEGAQLKADYFEVEEEHN